MSYATVDQLQRRLTIDAPTAGQLEDMQGRLDEGATEIDWFLGYTAEEPAPDPAHATLVNVNLDRAVELWHGGQSRGFGLLNVGSEVVFTAADPWRRHAVRLRPLRVHRGIA